MGKVWTGRGEAGVLRLATQIGVRMRFANVRAQRKPGSALWAYGPWAHFPSAAVDREPVPMDDEDPEAAAQEVEDA